MGEVLSGVVTVAQYALTGLGALTTLVSAVTPVRTFILRGVAGVARNGGLAYLRLMLRRGARVRFSASSILALQSDHNCWLLHYSDARGDGTSYWGPVGGVVKHYSSARDVHFSLGVQPHISGAAREDMRADLRVVMPNRSLARFLRWYESGVARESAEVALLRELDEELGEAGVDSARWLRGAYPPLTLCRVGRPMIYADPEVPDLWHYRVFKVYGLEEPERDRLIGELDRVESSCLRWVPTEAIDAGLYEGVAVGNHAEYLVRDQPQREAVPPAASTRLHPTVAL